MELQIIGVGVFPRIVFDRLEVILPSVPLNIVSKCSFLILNEGYDNLTLKHNVPYEF